MRKIKNCLFWCFFTIFMLFMFFMVIMRIHFIHAYLRLFTLEGITYLLIVSLINTFCYNSYSRDRPRFFYQVGHQPCMHLWEISIFSLDYEQSRQKLGTFLKTKYFKNQIFQKISFIKVKYSSEKKKSERFG